MKIIVFTKNNLNTPEFPNRVGLQCQHVSFNSTKLDDLLLIAKYRIVQYPMSLIVDVNGTVLMKIKGTIPDSYVDSLLEK